MFRKKNTALEGLSTLSTDMDNFNAPINNRGLPSIQDDNFFREHLTENERAIAARIQADLIPEGQKRALQKKLARSIHDTTLPVETTQARPSRTVEPTRVEKSTIRKLISFFGG